MVPQTDPPTTSFNVASVRVEFISNFVFICNPHWICSYETIPASRDQRDTRDTNCPLWMDLTHDKPHR